MLVFFQFPTRKNFMKILTSVVLMMLLLGVAPARVDAQQQERGNSKFEKKNFNHSEWTKGLFSEVVTVANPGKIIYLAGVGAEDENGKGGTVLFPGDFSGQCKYAYDKIKKLLALHGAKMSDVVKVVTYVTD